MRFPSSASSSVLLYILVGCCAVAARAAPTVEGVQVPFDMLLDTGVDPSVVDLAVARRIGLKLAVGGFQGKGGGTDTNRAPETRLPSLRLGGLQAKNLEASAIDLSKVSAALGRPIVAVLERSLLKNRIVRIDFPGRVVRFFAKTPVELRVYRSVSL